MKNIDRKKFFEKVGKGILGMAMISSFPLKYFSSVKRRIESSRIKVSVHPSAVKRNDKV